MDNSLELKQPVLLSAEQKENLSRELGITVDGDLFDPRYDYVFKRIFTAEGEKSKKALLSFLNAALAETIDYAIEDLTVINTELPVDNKTQKRSVFDIRVKFNNDKHGVPLTKDQAIIFVELSKLDELTDIDMWAVFLRYASENQKRGIINQILNRKEGIQMAAQILEEISQDEIEQMRIFDQLLYEADKLAEESYRQRVAYGYSSNPLAANVRRFFGAQFQFNKSHAAEIPHGFC